MNVCEVPIAVCFSTSNTGALKMLFFTSVCGRKKKIIIRKFVSPCTHLKSLSKRVIRAESDQSSTVFWEQLRDLCVLQKVSVSTQIKTIPKLIGDNSLLIFSAATNDVFRLNNAIHYCVIWSELIVGIKWCGNQVAKREE